MEAVKIQLFAHLAACCVALFGRARPKPSSEKKCVGMALAIVRVIVAAAAVLTAQASAHPAAGPTEVSCSLGGATEVREITTPGASFKVLCMKKGGGAEHTGRPEICADPECAAKDEKETTLKAACPGGTAETSGTNGLIVKCPQLPNTQANILLLCGGVHPSSAENVCAVKLQVLPPPPQGPQVCAAAGTTTTLKVHGDKGETKFGCPTTGLSALNPRATEKVFKEDCTAEEDLKDLKFTAGTPYNTLAAIKKPRTRKLCYVCTETAGKRSLEKECRVFIEVSGGLRLHGRTALGLAIPFVLAVLPLT